MTEEIEVGGRRLTVIDLSQRLSNETAAFEPNRHQITYVDHVESVRRLERMGLGSASVWADGRGAAIEEVTLSSHSGTHVDAPYHYGPTSGGAPARTIDDVPLRWCMGDGVLLDMTRKQAGEGITEEDVVRELERIEYRLKPFDIVLVHTGASRWFGEPGYELRHPGLRRSATAYLVRHGVRLIGIDAWGLDRPFDVMIAEAEAGDRAQFWESHYFGQEQEYAQIEKLVNLDAIPAPHGFTVQALPIKLADASAAWSRVVAIVDRGPAA
jgi:kynurenine formamidase